MSALADVGLIKRRLADVRSVGVMQATPVLPPALLLNDGPLNCRPYLVKTTGRMTVRRLAFVNLSVYLSQKVRIFISFITLFTDPETGRRDRRPEHSHRDKRNNIARTDMNTPVAIARCQDREWAEIHTPGHGYHNRVASYNMTDFESTMTTDSERRQRRTSNDGRHTCRPSSSSTTTSQTTDEGCQLRCSDVTTTMSRRRRGQNDILVVMTTWTS